MKISIITVSYNSANTIRDTFNSVLSQTYEDIEYIVVDGASKDTTVDITKEYEPRFNGKMRWISEPDKGLYDAMNKGIAMATGEYIGILNSDDMYSNNDIVKQLVRAIITTNTDAVYGDVRYVDWYDTNKTVRHYSSKVFKRSLMRLGFMPAHPTFICKRRIYEKYGAFDTSFKIAADFEHLLRLIYVHNITTHYVSLDCVVMREGGVSSSGISSHKQILLDHLKAYKKNNVSSNILFEGLRYLYKIYEVVKYKIQKK